MHRRGVHSGGRLVQGWGGWITAPPLGATGSAKTVHQAGSAAAGPRPGSEAAAGSALAFFRAPPGPAEPASQAGRPLPRLGTHLGSRRGLLWDRSRRDRGRRADERGRASRREPRSPRSPRSGAAACASDPDSGGAGGGAASGPGLPPPPAGAAQPRAGKAEPCGGASCRRPARRPRSPSTLRVPWPVTATDRFQVLPSPLADPPFGAQL